MKVIKVWREIDKELVMNREDKEKEKQVWSYEEEKRQDKWSDSVVQSENREKKRSVSIVIDIRDVGKRW